MASLRPIALALVTLLALAACQTPTAYQPITAKNEYGYGDTKLDEDTWRVHVSGNSLTPRDLVENQLLYRAAEIALANGAEGFVLIDRETERDVTYYGGVAYNPYFAYPWGPFWAGSPYYRGGWGVGFGAGWGGFGFGAPYYAPPRTVTRYEAYAEIRLYSGEAPTELGPNFVASEVLTNLAGRINRQPAGS